MNIVPTRHTGGPNWTAERFAALQESGITGAVARAIVAHWAFETGFGASEWNYNVGNVIALAGQPAIDLQADPAPHSNLRAYDSLAEGVAAYLSLLKSSHYMACWSSLQSEPTSSAWIECLGQHGYYTANRDKYVRGYEAAFARVSAPTVVGEVCKDDAPINLEDLDEDDEAPEA